MTTANGHTEAIQASRVIGTDVYNSAGESIGTIEDIMLEKTSNGIMFAVIGFGGFLGIGEKYHAIPWSVLDYDVDRGGYVVPFTPRATRGRAGLLHRGPVPRRRHDRARRLLRILPRRALLVLRRISRGGGTARRRRLRFRLSGRCSARD